MSKTENEIFVVSIDLFFDAYSIQVIYRACYAYTRDAYLYLKPIHNGIRVFLKSKGEATNEMDLLGGLSNSLIDFALRHQIEIQTSDIRNTIVRSALAEAVGNHADV